MHRNLWKDFGKEMEVIIYRSTTNDRFFPQGPSQIRRSIFASFWERTIQDANGRIFTNGKIQSWKVLVEPNSTFVKFCKRWKERTCVDAQTCTPGHGAPPRRPIGRASLNANYPKRLTICIWIWLEW